MLLALEGERNDSSQASTREGLGYHGFDKSFTKVRKCAET